MQTLQLKEKKNVIAIFLMSVFVLLILYYAVSSAESRNNSHGIIISEICTANESVLYDTNGKYGSDYIEIYNSSDSEVNLSGYGLSDNDEDPYRWTFPETILSPGECLILFGGVAEDVVAYYREDYVSPMLGFGFKYGEVCLLTDDKGECISRVGIPNLDTDTSLQVTTEDLYSYLTGVPSPGYIGSKEDLNPPQKIITDNIPIASAESGFYDDEFYLTLSSEHENDRIYYTLDGSIPDETSEEYTAPILIKDRTPEKNIYSSIGGISHKEYNLKDENVDKCTVLKAVTVDDKGAVSDILEKVYFVGFSGRYGIEGIPVMSVSCDPEDLFSYDKGIYVLGRLYDYADSKYVNAPGLQEANYFGNGKDWQRPANIVYFDKDRTSGISQTVGLRIHGCSSRGFNQKSFGLYADPSYGGGDHFEFYSFEEKNDYDKILLYSGGDLYNTKMRDSLVNELVKDRNAGYLDSNPCAVFLNGEYWGTYLIQEKTSPCTISGHYGVPADDLYIVKHWDLLGWDDETNERISSELWDSFDVIGENDMTDPTVYSHAEAFMDIQSFIDYCSVQIYIADSDWWGVNTNNTAFWRSTVFDGSNPYSDTKWRAFLYDVGASQGLYAENTSYDHDSFGEALQICDVFQSLIQNPDFRKRFVISFMDIANNNFAYENVHRTIYEMAESYKAPVVLSEKRWRGDFSEAVFDDEYNGKYDEKEFDRNIRILDDFYKYRFGWITFYLKQDLELKGELVDVNISVDDNIACGLDINTIHFEEAPSEWSGKYFTDYPITLTCTPSDGTSEVIWVVNGTNYSEERSIELNLAEIGENASIELKKR